MNQKWVYTMKNKRLRTSVLAGLLAFLTLFGTIASGLPTARAASSSEIKDQLDKMNAEQDKMQEELDKLQAQQNDNLSEIEAMVEQKSVLEQQVGIIHQQTDNLNEQISAYNVMIADTQQELEDAEIHLAELNEKNKERIRAMEEAGELSYWSVVFQANSFSDLLDRISMIHEIAASDRRRLNDLRDAAQEVEAIRDNLREEKAELEDQKAALLVKQEELKVKEAEVGEVFQQLLARGEEFEALLEAQEEELAKMEQDIAKQEQAYEDQKYQEWLATSVPPTTKPPAPQYGGGTGGSSVDKGDINWMVPCNYTIVSSAFGWRIHPIYGDYRFHAGVDLSAGCPTPIYATRAGVVTVAQYSSTAGNYVVINHQDGYTSTYMHMCQLPYVSVGQYVSQGQVIGCVGNTGASKGCHLHFGISYNGEPVNPMDYIG